MGVLTYIYIAALAIHALKNFWKHAHIPSLCFEFYHLTLAITVSTLSQ